MLVLRRTDIVLGTVDANDKPSRVLANTTRLKVRLIDLTIEKVRLRQQLVRMQHYESTVLRAALIGIELPPLPEQPCTAGSPHGSISDTEGEDSNEEIATVIGA